MALTSCKMRCDPGGSSGITGSQERSGQTDREGGDGSSGSLRSRPARDWPRCAAAPLASERRPGSLGPGIAPARRAPQLELLASRLQGKVLDDVLAFVEGQAMNRQEDFVDGLTDRQF